MRSHGSAEIVALPLGFADPVATVFAIVFVAASVAAIYRVVQRILKPSEVETPSSGLWVAWLRRILDFVIVLSVIGFVVFVISLVTSSGTTSQSQGRLDVAGNGITIWIDTETQASIGQDVAPDELKRRAENTGQGFNAEDDRLGETKRLYGTEAKLYADEMVELAVSDPSTTTWIAALMTLLLGDGAVLVVFLALRALLAEAARGEPFGPDSIRRIRLMAFAIVVGVIGSGVGELITAKGLIADSGGVGGVPLTMHGSWLFAAFVLFALAEVWRYGVALQRDVEATV